MFLIAFAIFGGVMAAGSAALWVIEKAFGEEFFNDKN